MIEIPVPIAAALLVAFIGAAIAYVTWSIRTVREANSVVGTKTLDEKTKKALDDTVKAQDECIEALGQQVKTLEATVGAQAGTIARQAGTIADQAKRIARLEGAFALLQEVRAQQTASERAL